MKLPRLQETKFNKRSGKETPVLRIYTTKKGDPMYFMLVNGAYRYMSSPYFFWSMCSFYPQKGNKFYQLVEFQARICGVN